MSTIYTRATKGSALTWTEGDANITNLNNDKIEAVVDDTTPQLGGDLDVNGNAIVSTANGNIELTPDGTGKVVLAGAQWPTVSSGGGGASGSVTSTDSSNYIYLTNASSISMGTQVSFGGDGVSALGLMSAMNYWVIYASTEEGRIQISDTNGGSAKMINAVDPATNVSWTASSSGGGEPTTGSVLTWGTGGALTWSTSSTPPPTSTSLTSLTDVQVMAPSNGQSLVYNSSNMKWENQTTSSGGISNLVEDTTPQLGGTLDANGNSIDMGTNDITDTKVGNWDTAYGWGNHASAGYVTTSGATTLDGLNDVVITAAATGEILQYNGTNWVDVAPSTLTVGTATNATNATKILTTSDPVTNATYYPVFSTQLGGSGGNVSLKDDSGLTYNPSTGTLTADKFAGAHNGTVGATTPSTGAFTTLSASGAVTLSSTLSAGGSNGTSGQVLQSTGTGIQWANASGGGVAVAIVQGTLTYQEFTGLQGTTGIAETTLPHTWTEKSDTSGLVTVSGNNVTISSAGTYLIEYINNHNPYWYMSVSAASGGRALPEATFKLYNSSDATTLGTVIIGGGSNYITGGFTYTFYDNPIALTSVVTITGAKTFNMRFAISGAGSGIYNTLKLVYTYSPNTPIMKITKLA